MGSVEVRSASGEVVGNAELPANIFGIQPNVPVMHQVVTAQLAAARSGTHSTKGRADVAGGGAKPWRQKGTGRARQGSSRAPHWRGGGVAHGPHPRSYRKRTPKKMVWLALRSALSDRAAEAKVWVVDTWGLAAPKTKDAKAALSALGLPDGERALVVLERDDEAAWKSFRNLSDRVHTIVAEELNAHDVLVNDLVVFTSATLEALARRATEGGPAEPAELAHEGFGAASPPVIDPTPAAPGSEVPLAEAPQVEVPPGGPGVSPEIKGGEEE
jgi:large subunit ribosomal protein L4